MNKFVELDRWRPIRFAGAQSDLLSLALVDSIISLELWVHTAAVLLWRTGVSSMELGVVGVRKIAQSSVGGTGAMVEGSFGVAVPSISVISTVAVPIPTIPSAAIPVPIVE